MPFQSDLIIKTIKPPPVAPTITPVTTETYPGEWVNWTVGDSVNREFIEPKLNFYRTEGKAIVFGNGITRNDIPIEKIIHSNSKKIINYYNVLYSCNAAFKDFTSDFLIVTNRFISTMVPAELHHTVYTTPEILRIYRNANLIPLTPRMDSGASAAYVACTHGAKKVFLVGFDGAPTGTSVNLYNNTQFYPKDTDELNDKIWQDNLYSVMSAYPNTMFYRVNSEPPTARQLHRLNNYRLVNTKEFVSLADI